MKQKIGDVLIWPLSKKEVLYYLYKVEVVQIKQPNMECENC